jgi:hypothetical protein
MLPATPAHNQHWRKYFRGNGTAKNNLKMYKMYMLRKTKFLIIFKVPKTAKVKNLAVETIKWTQKLQIIIFCPNKKNPPD